MTTFRKSVLFLAAIPLLTIPISADHRDRRERDFRADLRGRNEVPLTLSAGSGTLKLTVNEMDTSVHFVLRFSGLSGAAAVSHIHVGQRNVNGAVTVFFCGGGGRPACPASEPAVVEGDFTATDVLAIGTQQLEAGNLAKLLAAIRAGETYANVHTATSPGGEIRGQIIDDDHDHN